jgi:hypothetical protein
MSSEPLTHSYRYRRLMQKRARYARVTLENLAGFRAQQAFSNSLKIVPRRWPIGQIAGQHGIHGLALFGRDLYLSGW